MQTSLSLFKKSYYINVIFVITVLMPVTTLSYMVQSFFILFLTLIYRNNAQRYTPSFRMQKIFFLSWVVFAFIFNALSETEFYLASVIKLMYLTSLVLLFPLTKNNKIFNKTILICVILIFISQISYYFQISFVLNFIDNFYAREQFFNSSEILVADGGYSGSFANLRFGGIYRNPNQCGRMITLLFAVFLLNTKRGIKIIDIFLFFLFFASILLTGSRTALFVFILLIFIRFFIYFKRNLKKTIFISSIFFLFFFSLNFSGRIFDFSELGGSKKNSSFTTKRTFLKNYIDYAYRTRPMSLVFGTLTLDKGNDNFEFNSNVRIKNFDNEIGYIIYALGFFGVILIAWFYRMIYVNSQNDTRFLMIILFWSLTSAILTNVRFSFLFIFVLGLYFERKKKIKIKTVYG